MGRIIAICSAGGGVGSSTVALSVAIQCAKNGMQTILLDASGASRSCDLVLGMESIVVLDLTDVISRQTDISAAIYCVPRRENLRYACASLNGGIPATELAGAVLALQSLCDVLVIDMPTGECSLGITPLDENDLRILVLRPDASALRAADRMLSSVRQERCGLSVVLNFVNVQWQRRNIQYSQQAVEAVLDYPVEGCIPSDDRIPEGTVGGVTAVETSGAARKALLTFMDSLSKAGFMTRRTKHVFFGK